MWFLSAPKSRRTPTVRVPRGTFRLRLEALEDRCLLSAGALDPSFGNGGLAVGPSLGLYGSLAQAVVVQTDGKTVVGGNVWTSNPSNIGLERFNANATLDSSFGLGGVVQTVLGQGSGIAGLALQSDGKIVAVGSVLYSVSPIPESEIAVVRYNRNGSLDTTFGSGGIVLTRLSNGSTSGASAVAIQGDGKIDVAGSSDGGFVLARYNTNGTLDRKFGSSQQPGIVVAPAFAKAAALTIQSDGKIIVVGSTGSAMAVARCTTNGQLDSSFGTSGTVTMAPLGSTAAATGVVVQSNGGIVAEGYSYLGTSDALTLARLTSTGHLDTTFGGSNTGFAITSNITLGYAMAQTANGDLVVAGSTPREPTMDFGIAAFLPNGFPDATFGTGGTTTGDFAGGTDRATAIAIQGDGKIVAAGETVQPVVGALKNMALARFLPPDTKIGSFSANPNPVPVNTSVTLSASNILNANPTSTITQVAFYVDANGDGILQTGTDTLLGYGTQTSPGVWTFSFTPTTAGTFTLFAQAMDSSGVFSDPVAVTLQVI